MRLDSNMEDTAYATLAASNEPHYVGIGASQAEPVTLVIRDAPTTLSTLAELEALQENLDREVEEISARVDREVERTTANLEVMSAELSKLKWVRAMMQLLAIGGFSMFVISLLP